MSLLSTTDRPKAIHGPPPSNSTSYKKPKQGSVDANHSLEPGYSQAIVILTLLGFITRFYNISHPSEVVFDEIYFGRFASNYLQRAYCFDLHPPLAKLLLAFAGWLVGYDGQFQFDHIGDSYIDHNVPYVAFRAGPATLGALTVPVVFLIMWESGYSLPACVLSAGLILLDNAHIIETRLILLDATLIFVIALTILCYVRFYKLRHEPFGFKWWTWLGLTGFFLSCAISTKYVGLFTFLAVGCAVIIDLWNLLDINRRHGAVSIIEWGKHFTARLVALIIAPFFFYLLWFQIHFSIVNRSGPGNNFMTAEFRKTLGNSPIPSIRVEYHDVVTIRHRNTKVFLRSQREKYPPSYDSGYNSSQGQQVTGSSFKDPENQWEILPAMPLPQTYGERYSVKNGDVIQLRHFATDTILMTHKVASPYFPTNQEFTTISHKLAQGERQNDTLFEIRISHGKAGQDLKTFSSKFKLIHFPSGVAMWTHTQHLPDWAFKQAEISGRQNALSQTSQYWYVDDIESLPKDSHRRAPEERVVKYMSFWRKYLEVQQAMLLSNANISDESPNASKPFQWPFLLRGVSFWIKRDARQQIYLLGNPVGWWVASSLLIVFVGIVGADQVSLRRRVDILEDFRDPTTRSRLYNNTGFFFIFWAAHYVPFWAMGRPLYLYHYLPSHLASCLIAGALVEFIFDLDGGQDASSVPATRDDPTQRTEEAAVYHSWDHFVAAGESVSDRSVTAIWIVTLVVLAAVFYAFCVFAPFTYGTPGLDIDGVNARKWLPWDLKFS